MLHPWKNISQAPPWESWCGREIDRFADGDYKPLTWAGEPFFVNRGVVLARHFAHVSTADSSKIAFTESARHGRADRQTRMKPGKYLKRYFGGVLSECDIQRLAGDYAGDNETSTVLFARTPNEIERVYREGPRSCMQFQNGHHDSDVHPCRVYGAGDLAIAYMKRDGEITARCVVWPDKKYHATIYGDSARFGPELDTLGYAWHDDWDGARLLRIEHDGYDCFVLPYLDISDRAVTVFADHLKIGSMAGGELELCADQINGLSGDETGPECENCGERMPDDECYSVNDSSWCQGCYENDAFYCDECEESYHNNYYGGTAPNGESLCEHCASNYSTCDECDELHKATTEIEDARGHSLDLCDSCLENGNYSLCEDCGSIFHGNNLKSIRCDDGNTAMVCEDCRDASFQECHECGDHVAPETLDDDGDRAVCTTCLPGILRREGQTILDLSRQTHLDIYNATMAAREKVAS